MYTWTDDMRSVQSDPKLESFYRGALMVAIVRRLFRETQWVIRVRDTPRRG